MQIFFSFFIVLLVSTFFTVNTINDFGWVHVGVVFSETEESLEVIVMSADLRTNQQIQHQPIPTTYANVQLSFFG